MNLSLKARCSGCAALDMKGNDFVCSLGVSILVNEEGSQPMPNHERCYKPTTPDELKSAKKLISKSIRI